MKKLYILTVALACLNACSPTKGYLGPERPKEELSIVYYDSCDAGVVLTKASSEGVEFGTSGIELLPGKRVLDISVDRPMRPFNCIPETTFDQYGYSACLDRRNAAINKKDKYIPDCFQWEYTKTVYWCDQEFQAFLCSTSQELFKGFEYNVCSYQQGMEVFLKFTNKNGTGPIIPISKCQFLSGEFRRVQFSSMP